MPENGAPKGKKAIKQRMQRLSALATEARVKREQLANADETTQPPPPQQEQPREPTESKAAIGLCIASFLLVFYFRTSECFFFCRSRRADSQAEGVSCEYHH